VFGVERPEAERDIRRLIVNENTTGHFELVHKLLKQFRSGRTQRGYYLFVVVLASHIGYDYLSQFGHHDKKLELFV
jgi:hypothetical protein